jgi:hypothetical protein
MMGSGPVMELEVPVRGEPVQPSVILLEPLEGRRYSHLLEHPIKFRVGQWAHDVDGEAADLRQAEEETRAALED